MEVFFQWYESLNVGTVYRANTLIKVPKSRIVEYFVGNWGLMSWKYDLGAVKWIGREEDKQPFEVSCKIDESLEKLY